MQKGEPSGQRKLYKEKLKKTAEGSLKARGKVITITNYVGEKNARPLKAQRASKLLRKIMKGERGDRDRNPKT